MSELRERAGKLNINAWKRLVEMNRRLLGQALSLISPESAETMRRRYAELAYPEVHPDAALADAVYDQALLLSTLDEFQRASLLALRDKYLSKHQTLSEKLCRSLYLREVQIYNGHATNQADGAAEMQVARQMGIEREELNLAQSKLVRSVLSPEQSALLPEWKFESTPAPRPWDPDDRPEDRVVPRLSGEAPPQ